MPKEYAREAGFDQLLRLTQECLRTRGRCILALDGTAAAGKTTLAAALSRAIPASAVVHMDDFTMPFEKRFPGYFEAQLSNADIGRFDEEVLSPLRRGEQAVYRPYRCHPEAGFLAPVVIPADVRCVIVEGAYCLHPALWDRYDLRALVLADPDTQRARILRRNGEAQLARFLDTWIPMERRHIDARQLADRCDLIIRA